MAHDKLGDAATNNDSREASTKALDILELFEMVLLDVDIRQLFVLQRVCRTWRDRIGASLPLQVKLYLATPMTRLSASRTVAAVQPNPFFLEAIKQLVRDHRAPASHLAPPTAWHHAAASWQRMFLFSPVSRAARILINPRAKKRKKQQKFEVYVIDQEGVKLDQVWRVLDARLHALGGLTSEVTNVGISYGDWSEHYELEMDEALQSLAMGGCAQSSMSDLAKSVLGPLGLGSEFTEQHGGWRDCDGSGRTVSSGTDSMVVHKGRRKD
ncbi:hypothetical protein LTR36_001524 [Oleoguttula mirabilis]|uniref:F-box domain-containing protein n=1 Tax=Oleoguttula mirabilis TaxID=1507867 RepID=A0AAV9JML8_9PEZI|nr:hypothetical protein LTR36_001524 [Oleoguttula mirabilis]